MAVLVRTIQTAQLVRDVRGYQVRPYQGVLLPPTAPKTVGQLWPRGSKYA
jgi:hypothetical protein